MKAELTLQSSSDTTRTCTSRRGTTSWRSRLVGGRPTSAGTGRRSPGLRRRPRRRARSPSRLRPCARPLRRAVTPLTALLRLAPAPIRPRPRWPLRHLRLARRAKTRARQRTPTRIHIQPRRASRVRSAGSDEADSAASALAVYRLSHRYQITDLAQRALSHIIATLSPRSAFPLMLATSLWPDLHGAIKVRLGRL